MYNSTRPEAVSGGLDRTATSQSEGRREDVSALLYVRVHVVLVFVGYLCRSLTGHCGDTVRDGRPGSYGGFKLAMATSYALLDGGLMPAVGLGTFTNFGKWGNSEEVTHAVEVAIDAGYRMFDCAWAYQTEVELGRGIKTKIAQGSICREDVFIITKLWNTHKDPARVGDHVRVSLKNLQVDYVDLLLIHWPVQYANADEFIPRDEAGNVKFAYHRIEDTWKAMEACVQAGLVRHLGLSNFNSNQIQRVLDVSTIPPVNLQIEISPFFNNKRLVDFCKSKRICVTAFAPLGVPTCISSGGVGPSALKEPIILELAAKKGKTAAQIVLRYHLQNGLSVVPKSVTPARIRENIQIFDFELSEEEMANIGTLKTGVRNFSYSAEDDVKHPDYPFNDDF